MILKCIVCEEEFKVNEADMRKLPYGYLVHNWIEVVGDVPIDIEIGTEKGNICTGCAAELLKLFADGLKVNKNHRDKEIRVELHS